MLRNKSFEVNFSQISTSWGSKSHLRYFIWEWIVDLQTNYILLSAWNRLMKMLLIFWNSYWREGREKNFLLEDRLKTWSYQISNWEEQEQQPAEVVKTKGDGRGGGKVLSSPRPAPDKFLFLYLPFVKTSAYSCSSVPPEALRTFF